MLLIIPGKVKKIENAEERLVLVESDYGHGQYLSKLLFTPHNIETNDPVVLIIPHSMARSFVYAIPFSDKGEHTTNKIKLHFKDSIITIEESNIRLEHKNSIITLDENKVEISQSDTRITLESNKTEHTSDEILIKGNQKTVVPGNPDQTQNTSTGGFSKILYCPFTGVPHNTDTLLGS